MGAYRVYLGVDLIAPGYDGGPGTRFDGVGHSGFGLPPMPSESTTPPVSQVAEIPRRRQKSTVWCSAHADFRVAIRIDEIRLRVHVAVFHPRLRDLPESKRTMAVYLMLDDVLGEVGRRPDDQRPGDRRLSCGGAPKAERRHPRRGGSYLSIRLGLHRRSGADLRRERHEHRGDSDPSAVKNASFHVALSTSRNARERATGATIERTSRTCESLHRGRHELPLQGQFGLATVAPVVMGGMSPDW
jgi:hypothetical protein